MKLAGLKRNLLSLVQAYGVTEDNEVKMFAM
jgi:hypothetical protein